MQSKFHCCWLRQNFVPSSEICQLSRKVREIIQTMAQRHFEMRNKAIAISQPPHTSLTCLFLFRDVCPSFRFWSVTHARINSPSMGHMLLCIYWFRTLLLKTKCYVLCQFPVASLFSEVSSRQSEYHNFLLTAH